MILRNIITRFGFEIDAAKLDRLTAQIDSVAQRVTSLGMGQSTVAATAGSAAQATEKVADATDQAARATEKASVATVAWGNVIGNLAVQAGQFLRGWINEAALAGDVAAKQAQQIGLTAEAYQELSFAAELSGTTIDQLANAMKQLAKRARDASTGQKKASEAYGELGIAVVDSTGELKSQEQLLGEVATAFASMPDGTRKTALAFELFGRAGTQLLPLLNQGADGIQAMRDEAQALGLVMSDDAAKNSEAYQDAMTRLDAVITGLRNSIVAGLAPSITSTVQGFTDWIQQGNRLEIVLVNLKRILVIVTGITAVWLALLVVQKVQAWGAAIVAMIARLKALGAASLAAQAKMLLIPLAIVAIILAIEDLVGFMQGKDSLIGRALGPEKAEKLRDVLKNIGAILSDIIALPGQLWDATIEGAEGAAQATVDAWEWAVDRTANLIGRFVDGLGVLWYEAGKAGSQGAQAVEDAWASTLMTIGELFDSLAGFIDRTWTSIGDGIGSAIDTVKETVGGFVDDAIKQWGKLEDAIKRVLGIDEEASGTDPELLRASQRESEARQAAAEAEANAAQIAGDALAKQRSAALPSLLTVPSGPYGFGGGLGAAAAAPTAGGFRNVNTSVGAVNVTLPGPPDQSLGADQIQKMVRDGVKKGLDDAYLNEWANSTDLVGW